jgi:6-phosphogluconolactonase
MSGALYAYIGTYSLGGAFNGSGAGVYAFRLQSHTGRLDYLGTVRMPDPTWVTVSSRRPVLYAGSHSNRIDDRPGGAVNALAIDPHTGCLTPMNRLLLTHPHVAHVALDRTDRFLLAASSLGGAVTVTSTTGNGALDRVVDVYECEGEPAVRPGEMPPSKPSSEPNFPRGTSPASLVPGRSTQPHAVEVDFSNRYAIVADLQQNKLVSLAFDATTGTLNARSELQPRAPGRGPRALLLHPNGVTVYCAHLNMTLGVYQLDRDTGALSEVQTIPLERREPHAEPVALHALALDPSNRFLYAISRGPGTITRFLVDADGRLDLAGVMDSGCEHSRSVSITPDGGMLLVAATYDSRLIPFRIDRTDGSLEQTGVRTRVPTPACIAFYEARD